MKLEVSTKSDKLSMQTKEKKTPLIVCLLGEGFVTLMLASKRTADNIYDFLLYFQWCL